MAIEIKVTTSDLCSVAEAAKILGRSRLTIYRWIEKDEIAAIKLGGVLFIPRSEVDRKDRENKKAAGVLTNSLVAGS